MGPASHVSAVSCACWDLGAAISAPSLASAQRGKLWAELQQWAQFPQQWYCLTVVPRKKADVQTTGQEAAAAVATAPAAAAAGHDEAATAAEQMIVD